MKFMYKIAPVAIIFSLFITGCSTQNTFLNTKYSIENLEKKNDYIKKANTGDLDAMIQLNKYYKYPYTKEGLQNYSKWYEDIKSSKNNNKIFALAKIYAQYQYMFINGKIKSEELFSLALKDANFNTKLEYFKHSVENKNYIEIKTFLNENLDILKALELIELSKVFDNKYATSREKSLTKIYRKMEEKSYTLPASYTYFKATSYKTSKKEKEKIVKDLLESKDIENILTFAKLAEKNNEYKTPLATYEKAIELGSKDIKALHFVGQYYTNRSSVSKEQKAMGISYLEEASKKNHLDSSLVLINYYGKSSKHLDDYIRLKDKIFTLKDGKEKLAKYYMENYNKVKAIEIYKDLEKDGNKEALIHLALQKTKSGYRYDPEKELKRKEKVSKILQSNNPLLIDNFYTIMNSRTYSYYFRDETKKHKIEEATKGNILAARSLSIQRSLNKEERLKWLKLAIINGDIKSSYTLAKDYTNKYNLVPIDEKKSLQIYNDLMKKGDVTAIKKIARAYRYGSNEIKKDIKKAVFYYEEAAKLKDYDAYVFLARHYVCSSCNPDKTLDYKKAFKYVEHLAKKGNPSNMANLGWLYDTGYGGVQDYKKAFYWFSKAAVENQKQAMRNLGLLYKKGYGVEQDYKKALYWFKKADEARQVESSNDIGLLYEDGLGVEQDYEKAIFYYKKSAKLGNEYAMFNVGNFYQKGKGVKKDYKKAKEFYEKAAKKNHASSLNSLGIFYYNGFGVKTDFKKAMEYYTKASKLEDKDSFYNIGLLYELGLGVKKDTKKAITFYEQSGSKNGEERIQNLKK